MNIVILAGLIVTLLSAVPVVAQLREQPRGLAVLFFAEMWERFSYYGMRGLLIFYLTQHWLFDDRTAQGQYGAYTALVYLSPLIGGLVADRWLGTRKAVAFGALLLVVGHLAMGVEGRPATQALTYHGRTYPFVTAGRLEARTACLGVEAGCYPVSASRDGALSVANLPSDASIPARLVKGEFRLDAQRDDGPARTIFYLALSLIIVGVGFMKPNISAIVGQLYGADDPRRDPGFTLYYYGINLGAFWAAVLCGYLGLRLGWWAGFGLAGVGMAFGLAGFLAGGAWLQGAGLPPQAAQLRKRRLGPINTEHLVYLGALVSLAPVWVLVQHFESVGWLLTVMSCAVLARLGWFMARGASRVERNRLWLALALIAASVVFWTLFEQAGSSLNQFAQRHTQLPHDGVFTVTAPQTQSFNAGFILLFAPVFAAAWAWLGRRGHDFDPVTKFALALVQGGAAFFLLVWSGRFADPHFRVPLLFLALTYLVHTTGELCLSPVGLSQMSRLSPKPLLGTVMATWFLSSSWAHWLGGQIARLTAAQTVAGQVLDPGESLQTYLRVFGWIGASGVVAGLILFTLRRPVTRLAPEAASSPTVPMPGPIGLVVQKE